MENLKFGRRLRELRKKADLTQRELASMVNINFTYLSKIENGTMSAPSENILIKLADALNIDREELLIAAGKIPSDIIDMLKNAETIKNLRLARNKAKAHNINGRGRRGNTMRNIFKLKRLARVAIAVVLVATLGTTLWFAGPTPIVKAVDVTFSPASPSGNTGGAVNFTMKLDISDTELLPVKSVDLIIGDAPFDPTTYSDIYQDLPLPSLPNQTVPMAPMSGTTSTINVSSTSGAGWGSGTNAGRDLYGYGYDASSSTWLGWGYLAPLGTNFGYGYGDGSLTEPTSVTFTIAWQVPSSWPSGTYYATARIWGDTNKSVIESATVSLSSGSSDGRPTPAEEPGVTEVADVVDDDGTFTEPVTAASEDEVVTVVIDEGITGLSAEGDPLTEIWIVPLEEETTTLPSGAMTEIPPPPPEGHIIAITYDVGPDGTTFSEPIALTISYDPDDLPEGVDEEDLVLAWWDADAGEWIEVTTILDTENSTLTVMIDHFTIYGIIVPEPPIEEEEVVTPPVEEEEEEVVTPPVEEEEEEEEEEVVTPPVEEEEEEIVVPAVDSGLAWWVWLLIGVGLILAVGSIIFWILASRLAWWVWVLISVASILLVGLIFWILTSGLTWWVWVLICAASILVVGWIVYCILGWLQRRQGYRRID
ncbi:helix-turn-helix domain-containing protein [Chloroflexota bacterium]